MRYYYGIEMHFRLQYDAMTERFDTVLGSHTPLNIDCRYINLRVLITFYENDCFWVLKVKHNLPLVDKVRNSHNNSVHSEKKTVPMQNNLFQWWDNNVGMYFPYSIVMMLMIMP